MTNQREPTDEVIRLLAHDLRNPLTAVKLNAQLIEQSAARDGRAREGHWAGLIVAAARRMNDMLARLVEAERLRSGRVELALQPVPFDELLAEALGAVGEPGAGRIKTRSAAAGVVVAVDRGLLAPALQALFRLASTEMRSDAELCIEVAADAKQVTCSVRSQRRALDEQASASTPLAEGPRGTEGRNVTLHVARVLIECHGGQLKVDRCGNGEVAFAVVLPTARTTRTSPSSPTSSCA